VVAVEVVISGPVQIDSEGLCVLGKNVHDFKHSLTERLSEIVNPDGIEWQGEHR